MNDQKVAEIITLTDGFKHGLLPFRYLGVPVSSCKLKASDCDQLVDKMTARIKLWSSKHLSFAGRAQLINSGLMSICVYWSQMFLFSKAVLKRINAICRAFLWFGTFDCEKPGFVAWDQLCQPKTHGGLGFRNLLLWNQAAVGKQAWAIAQKQDNLWVKWIHAVYVKDLSWDQFTAPTAASWVVKFVCKVKNSFSEHIGYQWLHSAKYSIKGHTLS